MATRCGLGQAALRFRGSIRETLFRKASSRSTFAPANSGNGWTRLNAGFACFLTKNVFIAKVITRHAGDLFQKVLGSFP